jgi:hypothetical protein
MLNPWVLETMGQVALFLVLCCLILGSVVLLIILLEEVVDWLNNKTWVLRKRYRNRKKTDQ